MFANAVTVTLADARLIRLSEYLLKMPSVRGEAASPDATPYGNFSRENYEPSFTAEERLPRLRPLDTLNPYQAIIAP